MSKGMMLDAWTHSLPSAVRTFFEQGHVAVKTFFVLSGFVLTQGYARSRWDRRSLIAYGVARFARVYPVYLVSLLIVSYFIVEFLMDPRFSTGGKLQAITSYGLLLQGWMQNAGAGWNTPAWSLSCELVFYIVLPVFLMWVGPGSRMKIALLASMAVLLPILLRRAGTPENWKPIIHTGDFLMGIAAARIYSLIRSSEKAWLHRGYWLYLPALAIGMIVVTFPAILMDSIDLGTALLPLNGMLVLGLALGGGRLARMLSTVAVQYLGQISYSIYILHVPLLWWFGNRGPVVLAQLQWCVAMIYILAIVIISAACFEWIEKPANRMIRDWGRGLSN